MKDIKDISADELIKFLTDELSKSLEQIMIKSIKKLNSKERYFEVIHPNKDSVLLIGSKIGSHTITAVDLEIHKDYVKATYTYEV